jgi:hypothetical protein
MACGTVGVGTGPLVNAVPAQVARPNHFRGLTLQITTYGGRTGPMVMGRRVGACPTRSTQRKRVCSAKAKRKGLCVVHLII